MEILANEGDWTTTDEIALAAFLETPTGCRFIPALVKNAPGLLPGGDINAILIRSGEVRAFQTVIESIFILAHPPAPLPATSESSEYPRLENDAAWNDGQKLETPETPKTP